MAELFNDSIFWVEIDRVSPNPYQPRREFDQARLEDLAESIKQYGLLQPITVTRKEIPKDDGGLSVEYELIAGERRLRASKLAGLSQIPVIIRMGDNSEQVKLELAIIENLQREDINPIERAKAFGLLAEKFKLSHAQIGKKIGRSREYVSNTLRLLQLPDEVQGLVADGKIGEGHTRPIMMLRDKPEEQSVLVKEILLKKLTVREAESIAQRVAHDKTRKKTLVNPEVIELEKELTESLGTRVQIEPKEVGGKVVISYFSTDDLRGLLEVMKAEKGVPTHLEKAEQSVDETYADEFAQEGSPEVRTQTEVHDTSGNNLYETNRPYVSLKEETESTESEQTEGVVTPSESMPQPEPLVVPSEPTHDEGETTEAQKRSDNPKTGYASSDNPKTDSVSSGSPKTGYASSGKEEDIYSISNFSI